MILWKSEQTKISPLMETEEINQKYYLKKRIHPQWLFAYVDEELLIVLISLEPEIWEI